MIINPRVRLPERRPTTSAHRCCIHSAPGCRARGGKRGSDRVDRNLRDVASFRREFPSAINRLRQHSDPCPPDIDANGDNRSLIARITRPENSSRDHPAVPTCAPATPSPSPTANRASVLNGTYRTVLSHDEAHCFPAGERNHRELVFDVTFKDGNASLLERFNRPTATRCRRS